MARIRSIKPEFSQSQTMGRLSRDARLLFVLLWTIADDSGRAPANSRLLASLLLPFDEDSREVVEASLNALEEVGCIRRYSAEGNNYLDIPNWLKHQKIDHPTPSKLPEFREASREPREDQREFRRGKDRKEGKGKEGTGTVKDRDPTGKNVSVALASGAASARAPLEATRAPPPATEPETPEQRQAVIRRAFGDMRRAGMNPGRNGEGKL